MAKLIAIQEFEEDEQIREPYIVEDDYDISSDIIWDEIDECYLKNDNEVERTDEQYIIAKDNILERL